MPGRAFTGATTSFAWGTCSAAVSALAEPYTIAVIFKKDRDTNDECPYSIAASGVTPTLAFFVAQTNGRVSLMGVSGLTESTTSLAVQVADGWVLLVGVVVGDDTIAIHKISLETQTITSETKNELGVIASTLAAAVQNGAAHNGTRNSGNYHMDGDVAVCGLWGRALSTGEIAALAVSLKGWYDSSPTTLHILDQQGANDRVVNQMGGGSDMGTNAGGAVSTSHPPFSYDLWSPEGLWTGIVPAAAEGQPILLRSAYVPHMALGQTAMRRRY